MADLVSLLAEQGFAGSRAPRSFDAGKQSQLTCPRCSEQRKSKAKPCLTLQIDGDGRGATWQCHHCPFRGGVRVDERGEAPPPRKRSYVRPEPPAPERQSKPEAMYEFFAGRGISRETVDDFGVVAVLRPWPELDGDGNEVIDPGTKKLRWVEEWCLAFPYKLGGAVVNHKYRRKNKAFQQDKDAQPTMFNIDAIATPDEVVIVEGEIDVMALWEVGYRQVVTLPVGAGPANEQNGEKRLEAIAASAELLNNVQRFIIAGDMDPQGLRLRELLAERLGKDRCVQVMWPEGCKDANDALRAHGAEAVQAAMAGAQPWPIEGLYRVGAAELMQLRATTDVARISTGWPSLDKVLRVPNEGRLWVVTGIPGHGKTTWLDALLVNVAMAEGWNLLFCSPERVPYTLHAAEIAEKYRGKPFWDYGLMQGMEPWEIEEAGAWVEQHCAFLVQDDPTKKLTIEWILEQARLAILRHGVKAIVVDPWNRLEHRRGKDQTEVEYIGDSLDRLFRFSRHHAVQVFVVAHPSKLQRTRDNKVPMPGGYEISGAAHWANMPDFGVTVFRPSHESTEVLVAVWKVRDKRDGRTGKIKLEWQKMTGRYVDLAAAVEPVSEGATADMFDTEGT